MPSLTEERWLAMKEQMHRDILEACMLPPQFFGVDWGSGPDRTVVIRGGHRGGGKRRAQARIVIDPKPIDLELREGVWQMRR